MRTQGISGNFTEANVEALAVAVFKNEKPTSGILKDLDRITGGILAATIKAGEFKGDGGETALIRFAKKGKVKASRLLLIGMGEREEYKASAVSITSGTATRFFRQRSIRSFALMPRCDGYSVEIAQNATQGLITSLFELDKYKTKDKNEKTISNFVICIPDAKPADLKEGIARGTAIGDSMNFTRDLANEPPNILTPTEMAKRAQAMAKEVGLKIEILDEARMEKLGMGSLLSVSKGSSEPAKLIVVRYEPSTNTGAKGELLALVGKGITFDTGGISIKPAEGMDAMKYDMSGGATVLGTMRGSPRRPQVGRRPQATPACELLAH